MKNKYIIFALMATIGLSSCDNFFDSVTDVDIEPHDSRLVVFGYLDDVSSIQTIYVGNSKGYITGETPDKIVDATVVISKNGNQLSTPEHTNSGQYLVNEDLDAVAGDEFRIDVSADGYESVFATARVLPEVQVNDIEDKGETFSAELGEVIQEFAVVIEDDGAVENYYAIEVFGIDTVNNFRQHIYLSSNDPVMQEWINVGLVFDDKAFNGDVFEAQVLLDDFGFFAEAGVYEFNIKAISKEMYQYAKSYTDYYYSFDNPFAEPVTVTSNIEEEAYGVFTFISNNRIIVE